MKVYLDNAATTKLDEKVLIIVLTKTDSLVDLKVYFKKKLP